MSLFKRKKTNFVIKKTDGHGLLRSMYNTGNFKTYNVLVVKEYWRKIKAI